MNIEQKFNFIMEDIVAIVLVAIAIIWLMVLGFIDCEGLMKSVMPFRIWLAAQFCVVVTYFEIKIVMNYVINHFIENTDH